MELFQADDYDDHEEVVFFSDPAVGLRAIIAVHSTALGPALGGCRMWPYASDDEALRDVLRLSRGMTYKAAMARVKLGGGKSVVIADSHNDKSPELLQAIGRCIDKLGGRYITGEDIGTNPFDMAEIKSQTPNVSCLRKEDGGYGDPAPMTALGVLQSIRAGATRVLGNTDLKGVHIAVQGVGNVGANLCGMLKEEGARLTVCDVFADNLDKVVAATGAVAVEPDAIFDVEADILAPCAMGGSLNDDTIPRLKVKVVAGAANNQLGSDKHGEMIRDRSITYLPDYVTNGGGLICCSAEWYGTDPDEVTGNVMKIYDTCLEILDRSAASGMPTNIASDTLARERVANGG
jgi:leucine dehydrogenase